MTTPPSATSIGQRSPARSTLTHLHYMLLDSSIAIEVDDEPLAAEVERLLGPFTTGPWAADASYTLVVEPEGCWLRHADLAYRHETTGTMLEALLADINALALSHYGGLAVHAGVVARSGRALCLPGQSGAGKSTLTAACLLAGLDYLSDEALCFDADTDEVTPYPRPLALSPTSWELLHARRPDQREVSSAEADRLLTASELGAVVAGEPAHLAHVVHLQRRAGPPRLEAVDQAETMAALVSLSFNLHRAPEANLASLSATVGGSQSWRLHYDDPLAAAELLAELLA